MFAQVLNIFFKKAMGRFKEEDKANINFIADSIREVHSYVGYKDYNTFAKDTTCVEEVVEQLKNIGGAAKMLSDDFKAYFENVNWDALVNLENTAFSPEYETGIQVIWGVVKEELGYIDDYITQVHRTIEAEEQKES